MAARLDLPTVVTRWHVAAVTTWTGAQSHVTDRCPLLGAAHARRGGAGRPRLRLRKGRSEERRWRGVGQGLAARALVHLPALLHQHGRQRAGDGRITATLLQMARTGGDAGAMTILVAPRLPLWPHLGSHTGGMGSAGGASLEGQMDPRAGERVPHQNQPQEREWQT